MPSYAAGRKRHVSEQDVSRSVVRQAWSDAQYDRVIALLRTDGDTTSRLLLARTLLRLKDYTSVRDVLRGVQFTDPNDAAIATILRSVATHRIDAKPDAVLAIDLPATIDPKVRAAADYYVALAAWTRGNLAAAGDAAERAVEAGDTEIRALATELLGWIETSHGRSSSAIGRFLETLDILAGGFRDEFVRAKTLQGLAYLALETFALDMVPRVTAEHATLRPTPAIARACLSVRLSLASLHALKGDDARCYETLVSAREIKVTEPFGALVDVAIADFLRRTGSAGTAGYHLDFAFRSIETIDWQNADLEARFVPVAFAAEAAVSDDPRAGRALMKALSHSGKRDPMLAFEHDNRTAAMALLARGRIDAARGKAEAAAAFVDRAIAIWQIFGDRHMSCIAALDLMRIEKIPPSRSLASVFREIPRSWLRAEADRLVAAFESPSSHLSPAEERVLERICAGLTSRQIAKEVERSPSTVRNQTMSIFRKLNVNTRSGLVALVAQKRAAPNR